MNASDGGCFATTVRFQVASPASIQPARSPTRGSGLGAEVDMSGAELAEDDDIDAHADADRSRPTAVARWASRADETVGIGVYTLRDVAGGETRESGVRRTVWR